jgi:hypothetical protein
MVRTGLIGAITLLLVFPIWLQESVVPGPLAVAAEPDVDLGIADESSGRPNLRADGGIYDRPGILIAWRNTAQILEVEVLVRNLGKDQGLGKVHMEILDEFGRSMVRMPESGKEPTVSVPGREQGGEQGKIVQLTGTKVLNTLIDRLDRDRAKYYLKATVEAVGAKDRNLLDNVKVKSYNRDFRARPGAVHFFEYYFTNTTDREQELRWYLEASPLPKGWTFEAKPAPGDLRKLAPNQSAQGMMIVRTPREIIEGDRVELRMSGVTADNQIVSQAEWQLVNDNQAPDIISPTITLTEGNRIEAGLTANDELSGIYEASGVKAEYSTDGGITYSTRVISYLQGNFRGPTSFRTVLGPFAPNAEVLVTLSVMDLAGNIIRTKPVNLKIGPVVTGAAQDRNK